MLDIKILRTNPDLIRTALKNAVMIWTLPPQSN